MCVYIKLLYILYIIYILYICVCIYTDDRIHTYMVMLILGTYRCIGTQNFSIFSESVTILYLDN